MARIEAGPGLLGSGPPRPVPASITQSFHPSSTYSFLLHVSHLSPSLPCPPSLQKPKLCNEFDPLLINCNIPSFLLRIDFLLWMVRIIGRKSLRRCAGVLVMWMGVLVLGDGETYCCKERLGPRTLATWWIGGFVLNNRKQISSKQLF